MDLSRRHALAGAAALAAAPLFAASRPAQAAAPLADKQAPSFYRYKVGDAQVTAITDGANTFPLADSFVLVAEWGVTPRVLVRSLLQTERQIAAKTLG